MATAKKGPKKQLAESEAFRSPLPLPSFVPTGDAAIDRELLALRETGYADNSLFERMTAAPPAVQASTVLELSPSALDLGVPAGLGHRAEAPDLGLDLSMPKARKAYQVFHDGIYERQQARIQYLTTLTRCLAKHAAGEQRLIDVACDETVAVDARYLAASALVGFVWAYPAWQLDVGRPTAVLERLAALLETTPELAGPAAQALYGLDRDHFADRVARTLASRPPSSTSTTQILATLAHRAMPLEGWADHAALADAVATCRAAGDAIAADVEKRMTVTGTAGPARMEPPAKDVSATSPAATPKLLSIPAQKEDIRERLKNAGFAKRSKEILALCRHGVQFLADPAIEVAIGETKLGGLPDLPPGASWPMFEGHALDFVAQLRLEDLTHLDREHVLPKKGHLWFFVLGHLLEGPKAPEYLATCAVLFATPKKLEPLAPAPAAAQRPYTQAGVIFHAVLDLPPPNDPALAALLDEDERARYANEVLGGTTARHQLLGHVARDLDELADGRVHLFSCLTDAALGTHWGDADALYFFLPADRARAFDDFSSVVSLYGGGVRAY